MATNKITLFHHIYTTLIYGISPAILSKLQCRIPFVFTDYPVTQLIILVTNRRNGLRRQGNDTRQPGISIGNWRNDNRRAGNRRGTEELTIVGQELICAGQEMNFVGPELIRVGREIASGPEEMTVVSRELKKCIQEIIPLFSASKGTFKEIKSALRE